MSTTKNDDHGGNVEEPPFKRTRSSADVDFPVEDDYVDLWKDETIVNCSLTAECLFGARRGWFVRSSYEPLFDGIMKDKAKNIHVINGSAGIGKSSFLLYVLARMRKQKPLKPVLLHYHPNPILGPVAVFFPSDNTEPEVLSAKDYNNFYSVFKGWYKQVDVAKSIILVDGLVSFNPYNGDHAKYVVAKSPSCNIGWMRKSKKKVDRWLDVWEKEEMLLYANQLGGINDVEKVINDSMLYLGGVCRYAFTAGEAENAVKTALGMVDAKVLFKLVSTGLQTKADDPKIVDILIHRRPPTNGIGPVPASVEFATEYVSSKVAMILALERSIKTHELLEKFQGVPEAASTPGVLFEAYAARKISEGGKFTVKRLATKGEAEVKEEAKLELTETGILQEDSKRLDDELYSPEKIKDKLVWPNPSYNLPTIDMFMRHKSTMIAYQMTVSKSHSMEFSGAKAFLDLFDSVCNELNGKKGDKYDLYFAVPKDIYGQFAESEQPVTGKSGTLLKSKKADNIQKRITQWVMKVE